MTQSETGTSNDEMTTDEVLQHLEFGLWTAVALIPFLYYVNGASVSKDQAIMRSMLVGIAYCGAPAMRWFRSRRARRLSALRSNDAVVSEQDSLQ